MTVARKALEHSRRMFGSVHLFLLLPSLLDGLYTVVSLYLGVGGGPSACRCILSRNPVRRDRASIRAQVMTKCGDILCLCLVMNLAYLT